MFLLIMKICFLILFIDLFVQDEAFDILFCKDIVIYDFYIQPCGSKVMKFRGYLWLYEFLGWVKNANPRRYTMHGVSILDLTGFQNLLGLIHQRDSRANCIDPALIKRQAAWFIRQSGSKSIYNQVL